jgi:hypothetical protein
MHMKGKDAKFAPGAEGQESKDKKDEKENMNESDLEKSLSKLSEFAASGDGVTRKQELLTKAMETDLEKSEQEELFGLMGGESKSAESESHSETITKSLTSNPAVQQGLDVSDYLREANAELCKSLTQLASYQEQSDARQHEFNIVLARAITDTGEMVKAMSERLGVIARQPAHAPKSKVAPSQVMQKSFGGEAPASEHLSKSQVLDALDAMHQESLEKGMDGRAASGEQILNAIAKYENTNMLSKSMLAEVQAYRQRQATAH